MQPIEVTVRGVKARIEPSHLLPGSAWIRQAGEYRCHLGKCGVWHRGPLSEEDYFPSPADALAFVEKLNSEQREHCPHCENQRGFVPCPYCHWNGSEPPAATPSPQPDAGKTDPCDAIIGRPDKPFHKPECRCSGCLAWSEANQALIADQPTRYYGEIRDPLLKDPAWCEQPPAAPAAGVREQTIYRINHDPALLAAFPLEGDAPRLAAELADLTSQLAAANAEIARLLSGSEMLAALSATQAEQLKAKDAEIERLKAELHVKSRTSSYWWLAWRKAAGKEWPTCSDPAGEELMCEVERLMEIDKQLTSAQAELGQLDNEIVCLRESLTSAQAALAAERERADDLHEETEDLKKANHRIESKLGAALMRAETAERELTTLRQQLADLQNKAAP